MYILDTNVVSELRRVRPHGAVLAWIAQKRPSELHISAATVGEIQAGIEKTRENDPAKAKELEIWLGEVIASTNVLAADAVTFRIWAELMHRRQSHLWDDAMIAATALQHGATVVTRDVRDFESLGLSIVNPFS